MCPPLAPRALGKRLPPEGPQRADPAGGLRRGAVEANPAAGAFFDSLAQFYRKGYLRWIDGTRRRPQLRAERIAAVVQLLAEHRKTRRQPVATSNCPAAGNADSIGEPPHTRRPPRGG
jgi:hypothetical protein